MNPNSLTLFLVAVYKEPCGCTIEGDKRIFFTPKLGDSLTEKAKEIVSELRIFSSHNREQAPVQRSGCLFYVLSHGSHK